MDFTTRRERYRGILAGDKCVYPGSVFDPISARIAEDIGFEVISIVGDGLTKIDSDSKTTPFASHKLHGQTSSYEVLVKK